MSSKTDELQEIFTSITDEETLTEEQVESHSHEPADESHEEVDRVAKQTAEKEGLRGSLDADEFN